MNDHEMTTLIQSTRETPTTIAQHATAFDETYIRQELLGEGTFAVIFSAIDRNDSKSYAVKDVTGSFEELQNEIQMLLFLKGSPRIIQMYSTYHEGTHSYLIMEEMKGGDLLTRLLDKGHYTEHEAQMVFRNILEAVNFCHSHKIAHRDLKPENVLLLQKDDDVTIKLADFGLSAWVCEPNCLRTICGTTEYVAPEVFSGSGYDHRADIWSVGVILYSLLCGYEPFQGSLQEMLYSIQNGIFTFDKNEHWDEVSDAAKSVIRSMLTVDTRNRATCQEIFKSDWLDRGERALSIRELCMKFDRRYANRSSAIETKLEINPVPYRFFRRISQT